MERLLHKIDKNVNECSHCGTVENGFKTRGKVVIYSLSLTNGKISKAMKSLSSKRYLNHLIFCIPRHEIDYIVQLQMNKESVAYENNEI